MFYHKKLGYKNEGTVLFSSERNITSTLKSKGQIKNVIIKCIELLIIVLIIIALARPRKIDSLNKTTIDVIDILLVLDISSSMLADDFYPSRLEVVKNTAKQFVSLRKGDRIGIVVFAGQSFIQCPLTIDTGVLSNLIDEINVADREYDGTAIGMAIANGTNRLRDSESKSKIMILLSDGSNNAGKIDPGTASKIAKDFGIKIYTIAAGTDKSFTRIPGRGLINNSIDTETLKQISNVTNGKFFRATDKDALISIYKEIDRLEKSEIEVKVYTLYKELYIWLLFPSLLIALFSLVLKRYVFRVRT